MDANRIFPIIANCNFESRDDARGKAIHAARKAAEAGLTDDAALLDALQSLEETLGEYAEKGDRQSIQECRAAESQVLRCWTDWVQAEIERRLEAASW